DVPNTTDSPSHTLCNFYNTFWEAVNTDKWNSSMPTNALLISEPFKTADIEKTLVYGVHGSKELVVLLIK
ncbi:MAG TPA: LUD domain-containing protein, partial [SAR324 cluster bacterium]|nr:LUD domain-containing protein [SAR324 cluster bacterium]